MNATTPDREETITAFQHAVNLPAHRLEQWLTTEESHAAGQRRGKNEESTGHASGRRIVQLMHTKKPDLTDDDIAHMRKVTGYIHRHLKQRPKGDVTHTRWRHSLMNWGHDPCR